MNSFLNNNLALFQKRFPLLYQELADSLKRYQFLSLEELIKEINTELNTELVLDYSKSQKPILKEKGLYHHSKYDPEKEVARLITTIPQETKTLTFYGFGLGYAVLAAIQHFKEEEIILIEPSLSFFILALHCLDWEPIFSQEKLVLFLQTDTTTIIHYIEDKLDANFTFDVKIAQEHNIHYFSQLKELIKRTEQKQQINENTYHAYYKRWIKNILHNFCQHQHCPSVQSLYHSAKNKTACIVAAGPSLDAILPFLSEIKKRAVIICVDTALRACLRQGIEPDFIVLSDAQYWNSRHITDLEAPNAILVTEIMAYKSVFRFSCKEKLLIASWNPLGKYLEKDFSDNVFLSPGGTVASTAWELARFLGCNQIYLAGLDLGFPQKRTHTKGSLFEEKTFYLSHKFSPSEHLLANVLYGQATFYRENFLQEKILTDHRMTMYSWWFESMCTKYPTIKTYTFSQDGLFIPTIAYKSPEDFCNTNPLLEKEFNTNKTLYVHSKAEITDILRKLKGNLTLLIEKIQKKHKLLPNDWKEVIHDTELLTLAQVIFPSKKEIHTLCNQNHWSEAQAILFLLAKNCKDIVKIL